MEFLKEIPDKSINLVFTDPPFNVNYKYNEYNDNLPDEVYFKWCEKWMVR